MSARINEIDYVAQFNDEQKQLIYHICDVNMHLGNLHMINDHDMLMAIAKCTVIYELFTDACDKPLEREDLVDDCLLYYVDKYQALRIENQAMDSGFSDEDLDAAYARDIYLCQTIIDQLHQKTTDRLNSLIDRNHV